MPADLQKLGDDCPGSTRADLRDGRGVSVMLLAAIGPALSSARVNLLPALGQASAASPEFVGGCGRSWSPSK
jgi:hypothetical protein